MSEGNKIILTQKGKRLLGEDVKCIFYVTDGDITSYGVTVEYAGESVTCSLGEDFDTSRAVFERIFEGGVTPCTLDDVISDIFLELSQ